MRQVRVLHISDVHFGNEHRFIPEDHTHPRKGIPTLFDAIANDLNSNIYNESAWRSHSGMTHNSADETDDETMNSPLIVAITGDFTQTADPKEFESAFRFVKRFDNASLLGTKISLREVFLVPGNHDVDYTEPEEITRVAPFANFYSRVFAGVRPSVAPHDGDQLTQVIDRSDEGFIVAEINTALYVQRGTPDEHRGSVDMQALSSLNRQLKRIETGAREASVRIALLHHHPILVPDLVEPGREYDAVANSNHLLRLLRRYGFHLVLHGHKHFPSMFSYDSDAILAAEAAPAMVVYGGGSAGSRGLPSTGKRRNCYALFSIKWNPIACVARMRGVTRGLICEADDITMTPDQWQWETLRDSDRVVEHPKALPAPVRPQFVPWRDGEHEKARVGEYQRLRGNMAVCSVLPSLTPGQAYEVRCWIVPHCDHLGVPKPGWDQPVSATWSAGGLFPKVKCLSADDSTMSCLFSYWGPVLIQAEIEFGDGNVARAHTYAHMPGLRPTGSSDSKKKNSTPTRRAPKSRRSKSRR